MHGLGKCPALIVLFMASMLVLAPPAGAQQSDGEWPHFASDPAATHYSRLTQINKSNVKNLAPAWQWRSAEAALPEFGVGTGRFDATPIMLGDVLYVSTPQARVVALNAATGTELWRFDPRLYEWGPGPPGVTFGSHRGVATWSDGKQHRIFLVSRGRLFALDAKTGKLIPTFGNEGSTDMTETLVWKLRDKSHFQNTSPAVIYQNLIIVGSGISDSTTYRNAPPGDVQAFDVVTGKHVWSFHTIPQKGEFGTDTWEDNAWQHTGHANVWAPFSLDEKRGLIYLPVSTPANDHFGGERKGNGLFGDSVVCLDAKTGKRVWHFQTVHHNLWDYDGSSTPNLLTIRVNGQAIDVVAAPSKTGFVYVFDRVTGKPVWPIEERPVPQSDVPGEKTSPSQPFPTKPPPFAKQGISPDDLIDFTPELRAMAVEKTKNYRFGPIFNPPSIQGTLMMPGNGGGANWGGASVDPEKGIMYVKAKNLLRVIQVRPQDPKTPVDPTFYGVSEGPYRYSFPTDLTIGGGLLLNKPPYGTMTAIDLNRGEILWQVPVGDLPAIRNNPLLKDVTLPPMLGATGNAGSMVTAGGLLFTGPGDNKLYALNPDNGEVIWSGTLLGNAGASPMTYQTRAGRQFVVIGGGGGLTAFALPQQ